MDSEQISAPIQLPMDILVAEISLYGHGETHTDMPIAGAQIHVGREIFG